MKVTLKEIAKMAGVSPSTVSRVMNNTKPVNEEVRKRVLTVLKEQNYPPFVSQTLSSQQDRTLIGVICPQNSNTVLDEYIIGINQVCKLYGYETLVGLTDGSRENESRYLDLFSNNLGVQGIIFMGNAWNERYSEIVNKNVTPVIIVGQISTFPNVPSVHVDNITASYEAVTYLINQGHRNIAMIKGNNKEPIWDERFLGYQRALSECGISVKEEWIAECEVSVKEGSKAMANLLKQESLPSAVFCSTDSMAIGAMTYLLDNGYRVPEDFSIFGFDGIELSNLIRPRLSTISYSAVEVGMTATRNLIKLFKEENDYIPPHINVLHHLVPRESTDSYKP